MPRMKRILIVDDTPLLLQQLRDDLESEYDVVTALSGEEAVEILENPVHEGVCFSNSFDMIITDLEMPGMSGFDLADYVKQKNQVNRFTPVILLSSHKVSKEEARSHGCIAYVSKADKQRLISMVRILLSR